MTCDDGSPAAQFRAGHHLLCGRQPSCFGIRGHSVASLLQSCVKFYADSEEKVWEGCGKMGKGREGAKSHDNSGHYCGTLGSSRHPSQLKCRDAAAARCRRLTAALPFGQREGGCREARCGDGGWVPWIEGCDDGNTASGDGCSEYCKLEDPVRGPPHKTWTITRHGGPNHLGLWCDALPEHQLAVIASGCVRPSAAGPERRGPQARGDRRAAPRGAPLRTTLRLQLQSILRTLLQL